MVVFTCRLILSDEHVDLVRDHLVVRVGFDRRYSFLIRVGYNFATHRLHLHGLLDLLFAHEFDLVDA